MTSCYYEFAYRYNKENRDVFTGFITNSADKIFESTDMKLHNEVLFHKVGLKQSY